MEQDFNYTTEGFELIETVIKGNKKYFIEGYISTIDKDDYNEVVTLNAQEKILKACLDRTITMDVEHEEFIEGNNVLQKPKNTKIPVAKIVHAELRSRGVWVKAEVNQHSDRFSNILNSIKEGFLHSFSIAFTPIKTITKSINGVVQRFIEDLNLINVTLTGSPVNTNATFVPVMKALIKSMDNNMVEENNNEPAVTPAVEPAPVEPAQTEEQKVFTVNDLVETVKSIELQKSELNAREAALIEREKALEAKQVPNAPDVIVEPKVDVSPLTQIKSKDVEIENLKKENASLKARLATPILKSLITPREDVINNASKLEQMEKKSPLDMI
jgi:HK97 family phage prohead protease